MAGNENDKLVTMVELGAEYATLFSTLAFSFIMVIVVTTWVTGDLKSPEALNPVLIVVAVLCFISTIGFATQNMKLVAWIFAIFGVTSITLFCANIVLA